MPNAAVRLDDLAPDGGVAWFHEHGLPTATRPQARRIVMVSTHGYWDDPPPAGAPDTGGQTLCVLQISKELVRRGWQVIIVARWFAPCRRVSAFGPNAWVVRVPAGSAEFVRKEELYELLPALADAAIGIARVFGAGSVMGHYVDGMVIAAEVAAELELPLVVMPHSLAAAKAASLGLDLADPEVWLASHHNLGLRAEFEASALRAADMIIGTTPAQLRSATAQADGAGQRLITPGVDAAFLAPGGDGDAAYVRSLGVEPGRYLVLASRLAEAKNVPGTVAVLGELRRHAPETTGDLRLLIAGGERGASGEQAATEIAIRDAMRCYGLTAADVVRVPHQHQRDLAALYRHALCYVGMQLLEPFGMAVAEAMAAGTPVVVSATAGITRLLRDGDTACIVDPCAPAHAARRLLQLLATPGALAQLGARGQALARESFSWSAAAAVVIDAVAEASERRSVPRPAGCHRLLAPWRGDRVVHLPRHKAAAARLVPEVSAELAAARDAERRLIVAISGESGAGKTEIASYLCLLLRQQGIGSCVLPGDAFFREPPSANHRRRQAADHAGSLDAYLGSADEIDFARLDATLELAAQRHASRIVSPADCRSLGDRRHTDVAIDLAGIEVIIVDLTFALVLQAPALRVFVDHDYRKRWAALRLRNAARDPDQSPAFTERVLAIERRKLAGLIDRADLVIDEDGHVQRMPEE